MATSILDAAEPLFVQYFDMTPPVDYVDKALTCERLWWWMNDEFNHLFDYGPSSSGTNKV